MPIAQGIELTFRELSPEQARTLLDTYERGAGVRGVEASQPVAATIQSQAPATPQAQAQSVPFMPSQQPAQALVDRDGVPYNPDLHAPTDGPSKGLLADGRWKCKRNIQREKYDEWARQHAAPVQQPQTPPPPFGFPDARAANELTVPDEATVLKKAQDLAIAGKLTPAESMRIMQLAGTSDHTELVKDPIKRAVAWQELVKLEHAS